mgnify:CR=1 FL=1|jgi:hypothetical protein
MHPLTPNLAEIKDEELQTKINDLTKRLNQCYRFGPAQAIPQLQMLLQDYQEESGRRNRQTMEELMKKSGRDNGGYSTIIDIK